LRCDWFKRASAARDTNAGWRIRPGHGIGSGRRRQAHGAEAFHQEGLAAGIQRPPIAKVISFDEIAGADVA
jgi:hypothetical protein